MSNETPKTPRKTLAERFPWYQDHLDWLHGGRKGEGRLDLRGETSYIGADLSGADLRFATLSGVDFQGADLSGADLERADLSGAFLMRANLEGADLRGADLNGADLSGADLRSADLRGASFKGANLKGAKIADVLYHGPEMLGAFNVQTPKTDAETLRAITDGKHKGAPYAFRRSDGEIVSAKTLRDARAHHRDCEANGYAPSPIYVFRTVEVGEVADLVDHESNIRRIIADEGETGLWAFVETLADGRPYVETFGDLEEAREAHNEADAEGRKVSPLYHVEYKASEVSLADDETKRFGVDGRDLV